jgi:acyl-CoA thioesterase-1
LRYSVRRNLLTRFAGALLLALACVVQVAAAASSRNPAPPTILVVGDSLSAEYGLARGTGWVQLLSDRLRTSGSDYTVVNASISGDTTSGGRARLPALLAQHRPQVVVLELGGNDGLRGLSLVAMKDNLAAMIKASQAAGAKALLVGVRIPPNYGRDYTERFFSTYAALAREHKTALVPLIMDGFGESTDWFQADRIHPSARAQPRMLDNVWPHLTPLLGQRVAR